MLLTIKPMNELSARTISGWKYPIPYDFYNHDPGKANELIEYFIDPQNGCYSIADKKATLIGFCTFGADGQVKGGDYNMQALDIGMGMAPELTGCGNGKVYAQTILDFARDTFAPDCFRVTIAAFNLRAQRVWLNLNFYKVQQFDRNDCVSFDILIRKSKY